MSKQSTDATDPGKALDRVCSGVALIALHEAGSLQGHLEALNERLRIARRARSVGELVRDQFDLLPETRNRWQRDHRVRRELWDGLIRDLRSSGESRAA